MLENVIITVDISDSKLTHNIRLKVKVSFYPATGDCISLRSDDGKDKEFPPTNIVLDHPSDWMYIKGLTIQITHRIFNANQATQMILYKAKLWV